MTQISTLSRRNFITARRDPGGALAHIVGAVVIGLIVGGCFYQVKLTIAGFQNRVGSMYFLFILLSFSALSSATALTKARPLMMRERANGLYGSLAWLVSYVVYDALLLRVIPALLLSTILYWMVGMKPQANYFFEFLLIAILFHLAMALYNMLLAALIADLSISILFAGTFILFNIGFGGFLLNLNDLSGVFRWFAVDLSYEVRVGGGGEPRIGRVGVGSRYGRGGEYYGECRGFLGESVCFRGGCVL